MIEHQVRLGGVDCAVVEWNPDKSATSIVALHGWLDNLATFEPLVPYLSEHRVIAFDFPGHGHSDHLPAGFEYHFIDGLLLIDDLAKVFSLDQMVLLGHSMGGSVGCLYAAARPEKVSKLILIEALGPLSEKPEATASRLQEALQKRRALDNKSMPVYADFEQALHRRASVANIEAELIKPIVERGLKGAAKGYTWRSDPRLRTGSMMRYSEAQVVSALQAIEARVLLIEGDKGYFQASALAEVRKQHIRHLAQIQLSGGHHLHLENPRQIGEIIDKFVADS